jgi:hypothetical protein
MGSNADGDGDGDATGGLLDTYSIYRISLTTENDPPQVLDAHIPVIDLFFPVMRERGHPWVSSAVGVLQVASLESNGCAVPVFTRLLGGRDQVAAVCL